jgi:hypothetical protein
LVVVVRSEVSEGMNLVWVPEWPERLESGGGIFGLNIGKAVWISEIEGNGWLPTIATGG